MMYEEFCQLMDYYVMEIGYNFALAATMIHFDFDLDPVISEAYGRRFAGRS